LYGNFIITDIRPSKNTINILLIQLGWIFCRRHLYSYFDKRRGKEADASFKIIKYISKYLKNMNLISLKN